MTNGAQRFLSAIAYSVGKRRPIDVLQQTEGITAEVLADLKQRGLAEFCQDTRGIPQICLETALKTLKAAALMPQQVDAIVLATSNANWINTLDAETKLFSIFQEGGFEKTRFIGLSLQACSAFGEAASVASGLVGPPNDATRVLVILFGRRETSTRLGPAATTVYSDGAASCIISAEKGDFEVCASESLFNINLGAMGRLGNFDQFLGGVQDLTELSTKVFDKAGIAPNDIVAVFCTNGSLVHLRVMANAAKVPVERVYAKDVAKFAHVYSCDNLISLQNYASENKLANGGYYLLLGWSPHIVSAAILRYVKET